MEGQTDDEMMIDSTRNEGCHVDRRLSNLDGSQWIDRGFNRRLNEGRLCLCYDQFEIIVSFLVATAFVVAGKATLSEAVSVKKTQKIKVLCL